MPTTTHDCRHTTLMFSMFTFLIQRNKVFNRVIVNRGEWLWSPANIKRANKDAKIYVGRSTTVHNLLFCVHTKTFLLVSSSVSSKQLLCFVHDQGQKREQKHRIKDFVEFHNHSPLLTMIACANPLSPESAHKRSFETNSFVAFVTSTLKINLCRTMGSFK